MKGEKELLKPKRYSFELTRAEFLSPTIQKEKLGGKTEGLVAIEKIHESPTTIQFHYIGKQGIVDFIKILMKSKPSKI
jgi:hypothetical protein